MFHYPWGEGLTKTLTVCEFFLFAYSGYSTFTRCIFILADKRMDRGYVEFAEKQLWDDKQEET